MLLIVDTDVLPFTFFLGWKNMEILYMIMGPLDCRSFFDQSMLLSKYMYLTVQTTLADCAVLIISLFLPRQFWPFFAKARGSSFKIHLCIFFSNCQVQPPIVRAVVFGLKFFAENFDNAHWPQGMVLLTIRLWVSIK